MTKPFLALERFEAVDVSESFGRDTYTILLRICSFPFGQSCYYIGLR